MSVMRISDEDIDPLGHMLSRITGVPPDRLAGFVVMIGTFEEDGKPGGRLIASTSNLRTVQMMLQLAGVQVALELDKLAGLS